MRNLWKKTKFMDRRDMKFRGWLADVMACVDQIDEVEFSINDVYVFESQLKARYPNNKNVKAKIRQQLQILRDNGVLIFLGDGKYRRSP